MRILSLRALCSHTALLQLCSAIAKCRLYHRSSEGQALGHMLIIQLYCGCRSRTSATNREQLTNYPAVTPTGHGSTVKTEMLLHNIDWFHACVQCCSSAIGSQCKLTGDKNCHCEPHHKQSTRKHKRTVLHLCGDIVYGGIRRLCVCVCV